MGLFDRLRRRDTPAPSAPPRHPRGNSGRGHVDGYLDLDEPNSQLAGEAGLAIFDQMWRTDSDVRKALWMIINLIVGSTWTVEPYGGERAEKRDVQIADDVRWALFEHLQGGWKGHLSEALRVGLRSGFAPFEHVWGQARHDGRTLMVPTMLDLRLPRTIQRWPQRNGQLTGLEQQLISGTIEYDIAEVVYYRFGAEGDNWEGESLLRPAYRPWRIKEALEKLDAIKVERAAVGVPTMYPPKDATTEQLDEMEEALENLRSGEEAWLMMPGPAAADLEGELAAQHGWRLEILGHPQSESADTKPSLDYHSDKIAAALVSEFMRLGQGSSGTGSRATADIQQGPFHAAAEALSSVVEGVINTQLVRRIVDLNYEVEGYPRLAMSLVDETALSDLADYVQKLVDAEALAPDELLEDWLRDRADLPPADPEARKERREQKQQATPPPTPPTPEPEPPTPEPTPEPEPKKTPDPKDEAEPTPLKWGRELRWWEKLIDLEGIDTAIRGARERLEQAAGDEARALVKQIVRAAAAGKSRPAAPKALEQSIHGELQRLYTLGESTVRDELDRQRPGRRGTVNADTQSEAELRKRAMLAAESVAARTWQATSRSLISRAGDIAAAQSAGEAEAAAALRAEAQLHAGGALNLGRSAAAETYSDDIRGSRYTSILDGNRCPSCAGADDDVLRPLNDPVRLANKPPNRECSGGDRCRCLEFFELQAEDPAPNTAPSEAEGFQVVAESQTDANLVRDQIEAIRSVHDFPAGLPRPPITVKPMGPDSYGSIRGRYGAINRAWHDIQISLGREALSNDPPIVSAVHEIGHLLDMHGFGDGPPPLSLVKQRKYASSGSAFAEWHRSVVGSRSYRRLAEGGSEYLLSDRELLARSYEQYIATRSGNQALKKKIAARRASNRNIYWDDDDFAAIAEAFDRILVTRGLRR